MFVLGGITGFTFGVAVMLATIATIHRRSNMLVVDRTWLHDENAWTQLRHTELEKRDDA